MSEQAPVLSDHHRRFLVVEQSIVPGIINLVVAIVFPLWSFRSRDELPLWGGTASVGVDLLIAAVALPAITCLLNSAIITRDVKRGKVPPLTPGHAPRYPWHRMSVVVRAVVITAAVLVLTAVLLLVLDLMDATPMAVHTYIIIKAVWAFLVALAIAPLIAWWALARVTEDLARQDAA